MVFFSIANFNINAMNSGGQQKAAAVIIVLCLLNNLVLNIILISASSYTGAALATAATYLIMALLSIIYVITYLNKKIKLENKLRESVITQ